MSLSSDTFYHGGGAHAPSYYAYSANNSPQRPALFGELQADICVVGAGYSGLSTALHLAEQGLQVVILEGARVGWGASGRNGGQIVNGLNASLSKIEHRYGFDAASFVAGVAHEGGQIIKERVQTYNISCDLKPNNIFAALTPAHMRELQEQQEIWRRYGVETHERLDQQALQKHVRSSLYVGGMIDYAGAHMHPLNLALGEAQAFESLGGVICEHSVVTSVSYEAGKPVVKTSGGQVRCQTLVLCGNAYLGGVVPELSKRVMPVSTQVMATQPLSQEMADEILPSGACIEDVRYILDYYRLSADRRLIFGGGTVYGGTTPKNIEAKLRKNMSKAFPQLASVKVDFAWSGNFALSFSRVPQMGRLHENTYFAHGYSGHGVTGSHLFGKILAEAICGDLLRYDTFAKLPWMSFPGGQALRVPYSVLGSWWYSLRDRLGV